MMFSFFYPNVFEFFNPYIYLTVMFLNFTAPATITISPLLNSCPTLHPSSNTCLAKHAVWHLGTLPRWQTSCQVASKRRAHNAPDLTASVYPACLDNSPPTTPSTDVLARNKHPRRDHAASLLFFSTTVLFVDISYTMKYVLWLGRYCTFENVGVEL